MVCWRSDTTGVMGIVEMWSANYVGKIDHKSLELENRSFHIVDLRAMKLKPTPLFVLILVTVVGT